MRWIQLMLIFTFDMFLLWCSFSKGKTTYVVSFYRLEYFLFSWRYCTWELLSPPTWSLSHNVRTCAPDYSQSSLVSWTPVPCHQDVWIWDPERISASLSPAAKILSFETLKLLAALTIFSAMTSYNNTGNKSQYRWQNQREAKHTHIHTHPQDSNNVLMFLHISLLFLQCM